MSAIYYLKNDESNISYQVEVGTAANAGTVAYTTRSGTQANNQTISKPEANGNIPPTSIGNAQNVIGAAIIVHLHLRLATGQDLDEIYDKLSVRVTLNGGVDGVQQYERGYGEIVKSNDMIFFLLAIKLKAIN